MKNTRNFVIYVIITVVIATITGFVGYFKGVADSSKVILEWQEKLESAKQALANLADEKAQLAVDLTNAIARVTEQEDLIVKYELNEKTSSTIEAVRDVNIDVFKEAKVNIDYVDQVPLAIGSTKYALNPESFGYLTDVHEELQVKYYYGAVASKIHVENEDKCINISYDKNAFINPYIIVSRDTELNAGAKLLTNYGDSKTAELVNDVGYQLLSNIEDSYVERLTKEFANSEIPVLINGKALKDWTKSDKVFVATNPVVDATYSVQ